MQEGKRFNEGNEEEVRREGRRDRAKELMNYRREGGMEE